MWRTTPLPYPVGSRCGLTGEASEGGVEFSGVEVLEPGAEGGDLGAVLEAVGGAGGAAAAQGFDAPFDDGGLGAAVVAAKCFPYLASHLFLPAAQPMIGALGYGRRPGQARPGRPGATGGRVGR